MCTLSLVSWPHGRAGAALRLAFNRDELLTRPAGEPPVVRRLGARRVAAPADPRSGGTWIAVNDAGLMLALLNRNAGVASPPLGASAARSRGEIIPALMGLDCTAAVGQAVRSLPLERFPPFRLVAVDRERGLSWLSDGRTVESTGFDPWGPPCMFTSSGLGDGLVEGPRRALFAALVRNCDRNDGTALTRMQQAFHAHAWPDQRHLSVRMERADARTVSTTVIQVDDGVTMRYTAADDASAVRLRLAGRRCGAP